MCILELMDTIGRMYLSHYIIFHDQKKKKKSRLNLE